MARLVLDRLITLVRVMERMGPLGMTASEAELGKVYAARDDTSATEAAVAGGVQSTVDAVFVVRTGSITAQLLPKDRILLRGRSYEILGIKERSLAFLEILTRARSD